MLIVKGVLSLSTKLVSAPNASNVFTISSLLLQHALIRGFLEFPSASISTRAPLAKSISATPLEVASSNGILPELEIALTSAPISINFFTASGCDPDEAKCKGVHNLLSLELTSQPCSS